MLRTEWLRGQANQMAYYDKAKYATDDAMRIGRLHTHTPEWASANVAFMASGGFKCADKVAKVSQRTLVVWGSNDEIVPPATAERFRTTLPRSADCRIVTVDACGHVPHLEQPAALRDAVTAFLAELGAAAPAAA